MRTNKAKPPHLRGFSYATAPIITYNLAAPVWERFSFALAYKLGYNAEKMEAITEGARVPLISSTLEANIIDGVNYTNLLNGIFFTIFFYKSYFFFSTLS